MRHLEANLVIDAPSETVWTVLVDQASYPEWNPFIRKLQGELVPGRRLEVEIAPPGGRTMTFRPVVTVVEPGRRLQWLGRLGLPGIFDGRHTFELVARPDGRTELRHSEEFRGALVPAMRGALARTVEGFEAMNAALAARVAGRAGVCAL